MGMICFPEGVINALNNILRMQCTVSVSQCMGTKLLSAASTPSFSVYTPTLELRVTLAVVIHHHVEGEEDVLIWAAKFHAEESSPYKVLLEESPLHRQPFQAEPWNLITIPDCSSDRGSQILTLINQKALPPTGAQPLCGLLGGSLG